MRRPLALATCVLAVLVAGQARAADLLVPGALNVDPPTVISLGVQLVITGDDDGDAKVTLRYRPKGASAWRDGLPLHRVRASVVKGRTVPEQFAGSALELAPDTLYELELHVVDPDGLDKILTTEARTRAVPKDPKTPRAVAVKDTAGLKSALAAAKAGDVITLAKGTYNGPFSLDASGTADAPIVLRGEDTEGVVLTGTGATGNLLEVYGSFVHVEQLTLRNMDRGLRFQGVGAQGNVVRRVHLREVRLGIGGKDGQKDFYLCDNVLEGKLAWPAIYADDSGAHANDDGIEVIGNGHVVCHNRFSGFGDDIKNGADGHRSFDVYGNETLSAYDNAVELDGAEGNARVFRNRLLNSYAPISYQPIHGGPAYAFRNVVVNVYDEQNKLHSLGGTAETVGAYILHNTFVSARYAMQMQTSATAHDFRIHGNLFVGPLSPVAGRVVNWSAPIDRGTFDRDGYFPDGQFAFDPTGKWGSFAAMSAAGKVEPNGVLLDAGTFASGLVGPADYRLVVASADVALAPTSKAIDRGVAMPGLTDGFLGAAPDLGALELGCPTPVYGPRPTGMDETNEPRGCVEGTTPIGDAGPGDAGADGGSGDAGVDAALGDAGGLDPGAASAEESGCGCALPRTSRVGFAWLLAVVPLLRRRRRSD
ncbi:MAG: hypothetical protein IPJ34_42860 [Myxococcales bacterium]|nr:hypothetical protein [Myxococcales bacterium]